ncbi:bifunctional metallophosphatase/5'-nucleotidase, partial [Serratia nematodiphila]
GVILVPTTDDGRYTNVASINVKDALFRNADDYRAALASLEQQRQAAADPVQQRHLQDRIALIKALNVF